MWMHRYTDIFHYSFQDKGETRQGYGRDRVGVGQDMISLGRL